MKFTKPEAKRASSVDRSVPNGERTPPRELVLSVSSINLSSSDAHPTNYGAHEKSLSLYRSDANGNVYTNLNIQEAATEPRAQAVHLNITPDHVKYINLFAILCCWCFPITGVLSIIFARKTKRYYEANEMIRAKWYLNRAEWMLLLTFFFGLTLIATGFALFEVFWFKTRQSSPHGIFRST